MRCTKCGVPSPAPYCRKCFDAEIARIPGVKTDWKLLEQTDGSFKSTEVWVGIGLKKNQRFKEKTE